MHLAYNVHRARHSPDPVQGYNHQVIRGYYLGLMQALHGRNAEAAASLRATRIDLGYVPARIKLADVLLGLGGLDEAGWFANRV